MAKIISGSALRRPLESILEERKVLDAQALAELVKQANQKNVPVEDYLITVGKLSQKDVFQALAESYGLPFTDLDTYKKIDNLGSQVMELVIKIQVVPFSLQEGVITLVTSKPGMIHQFAAQFSAIGLRSRFMVSTPDAIGRHTAGLGVKTPEEDLFSGISELAMSFQFDEGKQIAKKSVDLNDAAELPSIIQLVNKTLILAVAQRSSDIHVESLEIGIRVRFRVDGVLADRVEMSSTAATAFVSRIMVMAGLDITERMMPQDGSFKGTFEGREVEFRIASMPGIYGQNLTLRILSTGSKDIVTLDTLGMRQDEKDVIDQNIRFPHGMILVSGPTGSGKSTTLYAVLERMADPTLKLITIEDPIERRVERVQQIQVRMNRNDPERSLTFARGLRSILRLDPDVIMVGEIRDRETAEIAVQASLTGHLVLSTVHANSASETLRRMQNIGVDPYLMLSSLNLLIAQRLMRRLCPHCRVPRPPLDFEMKAYKQNPPPVLYDHKKCGKCLGTGYRGRIGIFEFLPIDESLRAKVLENEKQNISAAAENIKRDLLESALLYVAEGSSDFAELERVLGPCH